MRRLPGFAASFGRTALRHDPHIAKAALPAAPIPKSGIASGL